MKDPDDRIAQAYVNLLESAGPDIVSEERRCLAARDETLYAITQNWHRGKYDLKVKGAVS